MKKVVKQVYRDYRCTICLFVPRQHGKFLSCLLGKVQLLNDFDFLTISNVQKKNIVKFVFFLNYSVLVINRSFKNISRSPSGWTKFTIPKNRRIM